MPTYTPQTYQTLHTQNCSTINNLFI